MRLRAGGQLRHYVEHALGRLRGEQGEVEIEAEGRVVEKAVSVAELVKRVWDGPALEQTTELSRGEGGEVRLVVRLKAAKVDDGEG